MRRFPNNKPYYVIFTLSRDISEILLKCPKCYITILTAGAHLNTKDEKQRNDAVHATGIQWSELLHLLYFDPSSSVIVDAMHNLFLGLVQEHFDIFGLQQNQPNCKTRSIIINILEESIGKLQVHERETVAHLINILEAPIKKELRLEAGYAKYLK